MPKTEVRSAQIKDATVGRSDTNVATPGEAVVVKIVAGTGITISSTGADTGTGDVTITDSGIVSFHHVTHEPGGVDVLANAAWTNVANTFTQDQKVSKAAYPTVMLEKTGQTAKGRIQDDAGLILSHNLTATGANFNIDNVADPGVNISMYGAGSASPVIGMYYATAGANPRPIQTIAEFRSTAIDLNAPVSLNGTTTANGPVTITGGNLVVQKSNPEFDINDTAAPADARVFNIFNGGQILQFRALNDAHSIAQATPLQLNRGGDAFVGRDIYEKGRVVPMGHLVEIPFSAANFYAVAGGGTFTAQTLFTNCYSLIGKMMYVSILIGGVVAGNVTAIRMIVPFASAKQMTETASYYESSWLSCLCLLGQGSTGIDLSKYNGAAFAVGTVYLAINLHVFIS